MDSVWRQIPAGSSSSPAIQAYGVQDGVGAVPQEATDLDGQLRMDNDTLPPRRCGWRPLLPN